jgi:DNA-binding transcriptional regulator YdaS (Cro superfamily)
MDKIIQRAVKKAGGITSLADKLGIKHQTIYSWKNVPADHVIAVERITGISRHVLRPDLSRIFISAEAPSKDEAAA